jgi:biofilm protein TabA
MKHLSAYKSLCLLIVFLIISGLCHAQGTQTTRAEKTANKWLKEGIWLNGLKMGIRKPLNVIEFAKQYHANKAVWDKAIAFLRDRNLELIAAGRYVIDGDNAYAMITEAPAKNIDSVKWEGHQNYIDLHYVIKGKEQIGVAAIDKATITMPYDAAKDVANYDATGKYYSATPDSFFLFFPTDAHRPGIKADHRNVVVKKLVIKIKVAK